MRRSKGSSARERLRATGPLTVVGLIGLVVSLWIGRPPPGPLQNLDLSPGGPMRTIGTTPSPVEVERSPHRAGPRASGSTVGSLEIRVEDADGRRRSGALVRFEGPRSGTVATGRDGTALLEGLPPGRYQVEVPAGCVRDLEIFQGRRGRAEVYADRHSIVHLGNVDARARFWPANPVRWSSAPPWPRGEKVTVTFSVLDRCRLADAPEGTSFARLRWAPNELLALVGDAPTTADADGAATIRFRCQRSGIPRLLLWDDETREGQDVLALTPGIGFEAACS